VGAIFESPAFLGLSERNKNLRDPQRLHARGRHAEDEKLLKGSIDKGAKFEGANLFARMRARTALAQASGCDPELVAPDTRALALDPDAFTNAPPIAAASGAEADDLGSSHFSKSEVEQSCTRIAVLNQGRMVVEGHCERTARAWVRLRVGDFAAAVPNCEGVTDDGAKMGQTYFAAPKVETDQWRLLVERDLGLKSRLRRKPWRLLFEV